MNFKSVFANLRTNVTPVVNQLNAPEATKNMYIEITGKLVYLLGTKFKANLAFKQNQTITVLDLASGFPVGFLALKSIHPNARINFVAIDNDEQANSEIRDALAHFPECKILTADAGNPLNVVQALKEHNIPLEGFSLIFLRQPNILDKKLGNIFKGMLQNVIPFVAKKDAVVFISTYFKNEVDVVAKIITDKSLHSVYSEFPSNGTCAIDGVCKIATTDPQGYRREVEPDCYNILVRCHGSAFQLNASPPTSFSFGNPRPAMWQLPQQQANDADVDQAVSMTTVDGESSCCEKICSPGSWCTVL